MLELMVSALLTIYSQFHTCRPDSRVIKLIKRLGTEVNPNQRRIICMNKVDLVEDKKDLLKVAKEFESLPAYERFSLVCRLSLCSYYFICFICVRINCIGLLGLHHLFYKGAAGPLGLQGCGPLGLQLCAFPGAATPGAASPGVGPRGSSPLYKCSPSPFNRII
jgi:hypothetical protein